LDNLDNDGDLLYDLDDPDCLQNEPPFADPNGPYTGTVGQPVQFDGSASLDPDGTITAYDWEFGDGGTGTGVNPSHTYAAAGTYTVTLTVTDDMGATDTATTTATIADAPNEPPFADPNGPYTGTAGQAVQFDGSGSFDPDGSIAAYNWDFGDGGAGNGVNPTHTYTNPGTYTVTLTVTDDEGATDTATTTATIGDVPNEPPFADPNGPYTGTTGQAVQFDGSGSFDPDGSIAAYDWNFGDGGTGNGVSPTHTYTATGTYTVTLTVTDDEGATDTVSTTATIGDVPNEPPFADPNGPYTGTAGQAVQFDGSGSLDPDGIIAAYDWDFGDGSTGTGVNPTHTYQAAGTYTVTLTVTDDMGAPDTATTTATIGDLPNEPPFADPNGPYTGTAGQAVQFDGSGSLDPDGIIAAYDWDFGDGSTGTGVNPTHTYAAAGTYTVTLTVTDDMGAPDTASTTATIGAAPNEPPFADPNGPYTGTVGQTVQFDGSGSADLDGTIVAYDWDFGDGATGTGVSPAHAYAATGTYTVTLTVTDDMGASDTATTTAAIGDVPNEPPFADPNGPYTGAAGQAVQFDGSGSQDLDGTIVAYDWDFGDGMTGTGVSPTHTYTSGGTYTVTLTVTDDMGATDTQSTTATIESMQPGGLDLDIAAFRTTPVAFNLRRSQPIKITLSVVNPGTVDGQGMAIVLGMQNGEEVFAETIAVSSEPGGRRTKFELSYQPTKSGEILWMVMIDDDDPDVDEAMATTRVFGPGGHAHRVAPGAWLSSKTDFPPAPHAVAFRAVKLFINKR
jgi:PKD repeat protein